MNTNDEMRFTSEHFVLFGCQEERQEAEVYLMGGKEPTTLVLDPYVLLENAPNSMTLGGQTKVPLKVTSLNFDTMCASQSPAYTSVVANLTINGRPHGHNHGNQASAHNAFGNSQKQWEQIDTRQAGTLFLKKGSKGENKLFTLPFQNVLKNISPGKERVHMTTCEPCPKKRPVCF